MLIRFSLSPSRASWNVFVVCLCVCMCGCVWVLPDLRRFSWLLREGCHPSLYPAFPLRGRSGSLLPVILPSLTNGTRSPYHRLWSSHSLSSVDNRNDGPLQILLPYRLCQTKKCLMPSSKRPHLTVLLPSLVILLESPRFGSIQKSTPDDSLFFR